MEKLTNIIEAILFASGDAVPIDLIKEKLDVGKAETDVAIRQLEKRYSGDNGIRLLHFNHKLQFATNPDYKESIAAVLTPIREREFTRTLLECAAIIAYKQPITRTELENIRDGVSSDYAITTLLSLGMIEPCGRRDTPGKPIVYATTDNFLKRFKLNSLNDLPDYEELMKKIADMSATDIVSTDLYAKDVYNPDEEAVEDEEESVEKKNGFDIPDFLQDIGEDIVTID